MAIIRICYCTVLCIIMPVIQCWSQVIYFPSNSSSLLKATVQDVATLLQRAVPASSFTVQQYAGMPASGIVLQYDSTISDNQACKVIGNGTDLLQFTAAEDNGLVFGLYQYLHQMGFRFYQPGTLWEIIPSVNSCYKKIDELYSSRFKYRSWFISGGHRTWQMDKATAFSWETYGGDNGHSWALYQRRNAMTGANRFAGHRGDIVNGSYFSTIQNNPCYVASYNGSRQATTASVPDVTNNAAIQLWANSLEQKFTSNRNTIFSNQVLYANAYRNFRYANDYIGIEVPDGPRWGNSASSTAGCLTSGYATAADQNIHLANKTVQTIKANYPHKKFQLYAYAGHANIPSAAYTVDSSIDVQVVATAFQNETSPKALLNRWYGKHTNISEYHYLNIAQWTGETPTASLNEVKQIVHRLKEKNSQGITWEASPAKFASLPFLKAANDNLLYDTPIDSSIREFCTIMFAGAAEPVYNLMQQWSKDEAITMGYYFKDNKYKVPHYLQLLQEATQKVAPSDTVVKKRLAELKAYVHYMVLYYDWVYDPASPEQKSPKAAALCVYLAKINKLQLVNSYALITGIASKYNSGSNFYKTYNVATGTAYLNGMLPLITNDEVESNFDQDMTGVASLVQSFNLQRPQEIADQIASSHFTPAGLIKVDLGYTSGADFTNRSVFNIYAKAKGKISISYNAEFHMPGQGYINFSLENVDKPLEVVKEFSLPESGGNGLLEIDLPVAGHYALCVTSRNKSVVRMEIKTNGNAFYKGTAFTHRYAEKYNRNMESFPGYFFVPHGMQKVFFSVNNSFVLNKGYLTPAEIDNQFLILDNVGKPAKPHLVKSTDSTLFYFDIPAGGSGKFWRISNMGQYLLCFANISNILWYGNQAACNAAGFSVSLVRQGDECLTKLTASGSGVAFGWEVVDGVHLLRYSNTKEILLPNYISPGAFVTLFATENCSTKRQLSQTPGYMQHREACASGAPIPAAGLVMPVIYPNPSNGWFNVRVSTGNVKPVSIIVSDALGRQVYKITDTDRFNLAHLPGGIYWYRLELNGSFYSGKILKN